MHLAFCILVCTRVLGSLWYVIFCGPSTVPLHKLAFCNERSKVILKCPFYPGCTSWYLVGTWQHRFNFGIPARSGKEQRRPWAQGFLQLSYAFQLILACLTCHDIRNMSGIYLLVSWRQVVGNRGVCPCHSSLSSNCGRESTGYRAHNNICILLFAACDKYQS